jgi:60 kDa SS-A/Ro ribonucleoprotein
VLPGTTELKGTTMSNALSRHAATPPTQREPIPGRDMVANHEGGYVFAKDLTTRLRDFIILGTEGGSYYADEKKLTFENVQVVRDAVGGGGVAAVALAVEISTARPARAPKNHPALFVVAYALAEGDLDTRRAAADAVPKVARTTDHLAHLWGYYKALKGKPSGRGGRSAMSSPVVRRAWTNWFTQRPSESVAYSLLKGRQRKTGDGEPFTPGDLLRLARPTPQTEQQRALFALAVGKMSPMDASGYFAPAKAYYEAQLADTPAKAVRAINAYHVPWEFLPDSVLKAPAVWEALIPHLGITALIRNLARMTTIGTLGPFAQANIMVARRLTDRAALHHGRVHPFDLMLALKVYESGFARPNPKAPPREWTPVPEIVTALNQAYVLSFEVCDKTPGRIVVGVDTSGSMTWTEVRHGGSNIGTPYGVGQAFAQILMRTCDQVWPLDFDTQVYPSRIRSDTGLSELFGMSPRAMGGTDVSCPIAWALDKRVQADGFVLITDNESWAGRRHTSQVLRDYRRVVNPAARVVVATVAPNGLTVADPQDAGTLDVVGFDSQLPLLVSSFVGAGAASSPVQDA